MSQNVQLVALTVVVLTVLALHLLAARSGPVWMGAVVPILLVVAVAALMSQGKIEPGRPYLVSVAALVMLLWMWESGRQARHKAEVAQARVVGADGSAQAPRGDRTP